MISKPPKLFIIILLIYSLCLIDCISAFGGGIQPSTKDTKSISSINNRGREWIATKLASSISNNQEDDEEDLEVKAQYAIRYCSKICILSFLVDIHHFNVQNYTNYHHHHNKYRLCESI